MTEQSLRAALEALVVDWRANADDDEKYMPRAHAPEIHEVMESIRLNRVNADLMAKLLADHPAEPAGVSGEMLDRFIDNGKRLVREERGDGHTPTTAEVERFIPPDLRLRFWERYVGKYLDQVTP